MTFGVGSTGVPTDRSTTPSGCARATAPAGASRSHGKSGKALELIMGLSLRHACVSCAYPHDHRWDQPVGGLVAGFVGVDVGRKGGDDRVVLLDLADLGGT